MKEKINIAELLKDCPSGMELDCTMYEDVYFDEILTNSIKCYYIKNDTKTRNTVYFNHYGEFFSGDNSKCVIFPKGKTTWEGFAQPCQFKDGDVLYIDCNYFGYINKQYQYIFILKEISEGKIYCYCYISSDEANTYKNFEECCLTDMRYGNPRFATEEEKQKLFKTIKDNGYKWNPETKTLEKLVEPRFEVGNIIEAENPFYNYKIIKITDTHYTLEAIPDSIIHNVEISEDKKWKLVPNKFDITTLKPFESKVLVRDVNGDNWIGAFYSHYKSELFYVIGNAYYYQCIPYEGNEHLLGTNNDCDDYFKNW